MSNHVHLLIRPLETPISRIMQSLLVSHTQRYHRCHHSGGHVWQGRFKSPVIQDDEHLLTVLRYIEANPLRARMVDSAGDYRWSSFPAHGLGRPDPLLDTLTVYESLARTRPTRHRRWSATVHMVPPEEELAAIRRSSAAGLPFGNSAWVEGLATRLGLDLTIRPRGRPRGRSTTDSVSSTPDSREARRRRNF
jgi:putative transposase